MNNSTAKSSEQSSMVIIGATSAIAHHVARLYATRGWKFFLVARNEERTKAVAADLLARGALDVQVYVADLRQRDLYADIVKKSQNMLPTIDVVLIAQGVYRNQDESDADVHVMLDDFMTNAVSVLAFTHVFASVLESQGHGSIVGLSSVAGDRGRRSNYAYGSSKAAITAYYSGLRGRLHKSGVNILTVKPGPVKTPMIADKKIPLAANVELVATDIAKAIDTRRSVLYTPRVWRLIMLIVRMIPEKMFIRLKF